MRLVGISLAGLLVCCALFEGAYGVESCDISGRQRNTLLALDWQSFDQAVEPPGGWRIYYQKGCYAAAADLLEEYIDRHERHLATQPPFKLRALRFHAGQMHAFSGNYESAIDHISLCRDPAQKPGAALDWNTYVEGTLAFLRRDPVALKKAQRILNARVKAGLEDPNVRNTEIINNLVACFHRSYLEAYHAQAPCN